MAATDVVEVGAYENPINISLEAEALAPDVVPYEFHVTERLSEMFRIEVLCACNSDEAAIQELIGQEAKLGVLLPSRMDRPFHGIVTEAEEWHEGTGKYPKRVRVVIRPLLWKLALGRTSRIFQRLSVPAIIGQVLRAGNVDHELRLTQSHPTREYCVQYMESDFAFLSRLMEEEGIAYTFRHETGSHRMILSDTNGSFDAIDGDEVVLFRESRGFTTGHDAVTEFANCGRVRAGTVSLTDYDPLRPALNMAVRARASEDTDIEIYDHYGRYGQPADGQALAKIKVERQRAQTLVVQGTSHCGRFDAGRTFTLSEYPDSALDKKYLLLSVSHHGARNDLVVASPEPAAKRHPDYTNHFEAMPFDVTYRPPRTAPWPAILGAQTAMVTGPSGEEIYTDEHGRVKVQFHWDRKGQHNEATTCWVRVNQGWAGPGWGGLFIPRIGHEVIVEFENGDPDRPMVTGRVYNGSAPPPVALPSNKTRSTVRTASSPGGGSGNNELRFEDKAGSEEVYLHAQKDLNMTVENDKKQTIKGDETLEVKKDRTREIQGNQTLVVKKNDDSTVEMVQHTTVNGNRSTTVGGNHSESVAGNQQITVGAAHSLTVALASAETVGAAKALTVGDAMTLSVGAAMVSTVVGALDESVGEEKSETVGGDKKESIKGDHTVDVGGDWTESIDKNRSIKVKGDAMQGVDGNTTHTVKKTLKVDAKEIHFAAKDELQIKVGSASILMKKSGDVIIKGGKVEVTASGDLIMKGSKIGEN
jgi:type VI secretion system secreted protein VgrG